MTINTFMQQLAKELDLDESMAAAEGGGYTIPLEDDVKINITSASNGNFSFTCALGTCPSSNQEQFFTKALHANLFGQGTHGAKLGLDENGNVLTLSKVMNYNTDYKDFKDALEDFINSVDFWREEARTHK